jgi:hypothetical protein
MGKWKQFVMEVQELVYSAIDAEIRDTDEILKYVNDRLGMTKATRDMVENILAEMFGPNEQEYNQAMLDSSGDL